MSAHKWQFSARFRRNIFGWRSQVPIQRIREEVTEIRKISRKELQTLLLFELLSKNTRGNYPQRFSMI